MFRQCPKFPSELVGDTISRQNCGTNPAKTGIF